MTRPRQTKPGVYLDLSNEDYHNGQGVSKSQLDLIEKSPAHLDFAKKHTKRDSKAMKRGRAIHAAILEPMVFKRDYIVAPEDAPNRPTITQLNAKKPSSATVEAIEFWQAFDEANEGKTILSRAAGADPIWNPSEYDLVCRVTDAVLEDPDAESLINRKGVYESSVYWKDQKTKALCRCRPDFWAANDQIVVDLKTTAEATEEAIQRTIMKFRYHVQDAFYTDGIKQAIKQAGLNISEPKVFAFIFVETKPPYTVKVYYLDRQSIDVGRWEYERNLATYASCLAHDEWPKDHSQARRIGLPDWYMARKLEQMSA